MWGVTVTDDSSDRVVVDVKTGEAIEPTGINTTGSLVQANGVRHAVCGQTVNYVVVSSTHSALHCSRCGLRVVFPVDIKTFDKLAEYFSSQQSHTD